MANHSSMLSAEITRIIECPYPASLSHLADLLTRANTLTIRACIHDLSPCAVSKLAVLVHEALSICAYALHVLSSLCQSREFRDAVLCQNPGLLNGLLTKANSSSRDFDEYAELCVLLLSRPLPACAPLPASAQPFFLRVFEKANQNPDVSTLKAVYSMLNGACGNLLSLLSAERREQFDQGLSHILSDHNTGQASILLLWCFGIALIVEHPFQADIQHPSQASSEQETQSASAVAEKRWTTAAAHKMFGSTSKMNKTIYLTYLSVIWATKGDVGVADDEAIEGIQIAIRTLQSVDQTVLKNWPRTSAIVKSTIPRLPSKVLRTNINSTLQLQALTFYAKATAGAPSAEVVTQYEHCLLSIASLGNTQCLGDTLSTSLPMFSPHLQQSSIQTLINGLLDTCSSTTSHAASSSYTLLAERLAKILPDCAVLHAKVLSAVLSSDVQAKIWSLIRAKTETIRQNSGPVLAMSSHHELVSATISFLLALALTVQSDAPRLPNAMIMALIHKHKSESRIETLCTHISNAPEVSSVSLFQQKNTPFSGQPLQDWRHRLNSELESQGSYHRDSVIRSVAQICQDLETRCNTAEEPLLQEKEKSRQLEQTVADLKTRVSFLESEATDSRFHLEGLEDEKLNLFDENQRLSRKLDGLQGNLDEANRNADEMSRQHQEDIQAKELELRSTMLEHEECLYKHREDLEARDETMNKLREEFQLVSDQMALLSREHKGLRSGLNEANQQLNHEVEKALVQSEEILRLGDRNTGLELQLQGTEADLDTTTARLSELEVSHQELVHTSEEAYRDLQLEHQRDMDAADAAAKETAEALQAQLQEALQHGLQAEAEHGETRRELEQLHTSIPALESRIQELADFCAEQEEELEELRALRKNVLAGLGLASQHPLTIRPTARAAKDHAIQMPEEPREQRRRKSAINTLDGVSKASRNTQGVTSTALETVANASFGSSDSHSSQNEPTPKRSKPRPSFKVPAMRTPLNKKPLPSSRSMSNKLSPSKRSALRQLSPNRRHTTVGFVVSEDDAVYNNELRSARKKRGSLHDIDEVDFDMDDFMAGTPMTPGNFVTGTGRIPDDEDVTTTEL
ncbi:hypothetical protein EK21DRAFT_112078 [Setomelanomma holmii]|uniref:Uncharacterized protein n=1 Tax=Setomelanomma holmii TaxID=210430 RepID=A0A9P4H8R1_9PLEO|nr:hypothetical protein EK21DRAFT_112078 [Setomelanomma holmii]